MPLDHGQSLSFYEILDPLGAGGMGEVYRARDTRLDREVAIKVLPESLADDMERLQRFEREAKTLASLNHTNIAGIHGIDQVGDTCFIAMELVSGEDLSQRLERGALPADEALEVGRQIAAGLELAHEAGVVHRDLKPANVRITIEGTVKILDFGLAKPLRPRTTGSGSSKISTTTAEADSFVLTSEGMVLGTPTYMSPEQARGKPIDRRTDIWAFGCVLFECLTGKRAFGGDNFSDVTAAILKGEPDWAALEGRASAATVRLLRRCLEKDPAKRIRDIGDVGLELDELRSGHASENDADPTTSRSSSRRGLAAGVAAGLVAGALLWNAVGDRSESTEAPPRMQLSLQLEAHQELLTAGNTLLVFAPDGKSLVFCGTVNGQRMLFRRDLDGQKVVAIPGTEDGEGPFFSPDGQWLGFTTSSQLMRVPYAGGRPLAMTPSQGAGGAAWLDDDTLVYAPMYSEGLFRVSIEGGPQERLTTPDTGAGELGHWWPQPLPGERWILFTAYRTPVDRSRIGVLDLETGQTRVIVEGGIHGQYVSTGHLLYTRGTRLFAVPFDTETATTKGPAVAVLDEVLVSQSNGCAQVHVSPHGTLAYVTVSSGDPLRQLVWIDRTGIASPAAEQLQRYKGVSLSHDEERAALTIQGDSLDLWTYTFDRGTLSRLTSGERPEMNPTWSLDDRELFYVTEQPWYELHRITVGDPDSGRPIWDDTLELDATTIAVAPDGETIGFTLSEPETGRNVYARRLDGSEPNQVVRATRAEETFLSFSPDGNWITYESSETGRPEIYVEAFPGPGERIQVSAHGGVEPLWAGNGEIFFRHEGELHVIATRSGETFEFDPPERLFSLQLAFRYRTARMYDVTSDGQKILAVITPDATRPRRIEIVPNWAKELEELAGE